MQCSLVDIEKPSALKSMFGPFHGAVKFDSGGHNTATVTFPDARSLADARQRVGGGVRGTFRVLRSANGTADGAHGAAPGSAGSAAASATAHSMRNGSAASASVAAVSTAPAGSGSGRWERPGALSNAGSVSSARGAPAHGVQRAAAAKMDFSVARNPFAFPDAEQQAGVGVNTAPTVGVTSSMLRKRRDEKVAQAQLQSDAVSSLAEHSDSGSASSGSAQALQLRDDVAPSVLAANPGTHMSLQQNGTTHMGSIQGTGDVDSASLQPQGVISDGLHQSAEEVEDWEAWEP